MDGRVDKKYGSHLEGVKCVVNSCSYHENGDCCGAAKIEIQPRNASDTQETDCATFTPKS